MSKYLRLSYILNNETPAYGNFAEVELPPINSISKGDTSNNTKININSHIGTHIDFPKHFIETGRSGDEFNPEELIFNYPEIIEISKKNGLIYNNDLINLSPNKNTEFLIIKTGICYDRSKQNYWEDNPGFANETAAYLKELYPNLKGIGFDSISLTSFQNRPEGRVAHKEYLSREILIVEDMDLRNIDTSIKISRLFIAPLLFENCDGAPVYVLAEL